MGETMTIRQRILRRLIVLLLGIVICFSFLTVGTITYVKADSTVLPKITVEHKTVHRGQTFELNVTLDENPGLTAMLLEITYYKSVMSLVGIERGDALETHTFTPTNTDTDEGFLIEPFRLLWDGTTQDNTTGLLITLTFESKITAPLGVYPVNLTYDAKNTNSEYNKPIAVDIDNGIVTLITGEYDVVYKNYDGTELQRIDYNGGDSVPTYSGKTPTRPTDEMYSYTFSEWKGAVPNVEKEVWYVADYKKTPIEYQVTYYVDGKFFDGEIVGYNEVVDLTKTPSKQNYNFSGWYLDAEFKQKVTFYRMPAGDLSLYGYMQYNIRQDEIPQITLSVDRVENGIAFVNVDVTRNPSLAGLILTLDYDRTALEFIGFEKGEIFETKQFTTTNTDGGYGVDSFKFYWEHTENSYETGKLLTLKFKVDETVSAGLYNVTLTYNENTDATFVTDEQELWYTKLEIIGTSVPIGKIYHWYEETQDGIGIDVTTAEGQSPDTILEIKRVSHIVSVEEKTVLDAAGENMELKDVYSVRLLRNGVEVKPNGKITVKIELTEAQAGCKKIMVFHLDENGKLTYYESKIENGFVAFETEHLSNWAIVGNVIFGAGGTTQNPNTAILIIAPTLLAIVAMGFALILIARAKKKKQVFVYTKDE